MMDGILECTQLCKSFRLPGDQVLQAVDNLSLQLKPGQTLVIRGPSGSGKTTLLMMLAGMLAPCSGQVRLAGQDVYALSPSRRANLRRTSMGVVLPMFHLLPYLDAADNVSLGDTSSRARRRAIELLDQFGLASRARQLPDSMSAGERRRLMVARALMHRPEIVLADEPTSNLDDENASHIRKVLLEETRPSGVLVVVTHEPPSMYDTELCFSLPNG